MPETESFVWLLMLITTVHHLISLISSSQLVTWCYVVFMPSGERKRESVGVVKSQANQDHAQVTELNYI